MLLVPYGDLLYNSRETKITIKKVRTFLQQHKSAKYHEKSLIMFYFYRSFLKLLTISVASVVVVSSLALLLSMSSSVQEILKVGGLGSLELLVLSSAEELEFEVPLLLLCEFSALLIRALRKLIIMIRDLASTVLPVIEYSLKINFGK